MTFFGCVTASWLLLSAVVLFLGSRAYDMDPLLKLLRNILIVYALGFLLINQLLAMFTLSGTEALLSIVSVVALIMTVTRGISQRTEKPFMLGLLFVALGTFFGMQNLEVLGSWQNWQHR